MSKIYHLSRSGFRLLHKVRHRRGHGIHSPFIYNLITKVIEEKAAYYAYKDIPHFLNLYAYKKKINKINKLAFRLVNYFGARNILEITSGYGVNTLYLTASSSQIVCNVFEYSTKKRKKVQQLYDNYDRNITVWDKELPRLSTKQDCIFIDLKNCRFKKEELHTYLLDLVTADSFIIMKGIRTNKASWMLWYQMRSDDSVGITLDLFHLGIVFFDRKYHKRNYKINF